MSFLRPQQFADEGIPQEVASFRDKLSMLTVWSTLLGCLGCFYYFWVTRHKIHYDELITTYDEFLSLKEELESDGQEVVCHCTFGGSGVPVQFGVLLSTVLPASYRMLEYASNDSAFVNIYSDFVATMNESVYNLTMSGLSFGNASEEIFPYGMACLSGFLFGVVHVDIPLALMDQTEMASFWTITISDLCDSSMRALGLSAVTKFADAVIDLNPDQFTGNITELAHLYSEQYDSQLERIRSLYDGSLKTRNDFLSAVMDILNRQIVDYFRICKADFCTIARDAEFHDVMADFMAYPASIFSLFCLFYGALYSGYQGRKMSRMSTAPGNGEQIELAPVSATATTAMTQSSAFLKVAKSADQEARERHARRASRTSGTRNHSLDDSVSPPLNSRDRKMKAIIYELSKLKEELDNFKCAQLQRDELSVIDLKANRGMSPRKPIERKNEEPKNPTLVALVQHSSDNPRKLSFAKGDLIEVLPNQSTGEGYSKWQYGVLKHSSSFPITGIPAYFPPSYATTAR